jgi:hypothetical protein
VKSRLVARRQLKPSLIYRGGLIRCPLVRKLPTPLSTKDDPARSASPRFALHGVSGIHLMNEHRHSDLAGQAHFIRVKKKGTGAMSGGKPGRSGRKSFVATPEQRNNVKILVGLGVPQAMICQLVVNPQTGKPLDEGTLKKHFPREIAVMANSRSL